MRVDITYSDIRQMINESVKRILKESYYGAQSVSGTLNLVSMIGDKLNLDDETISKVLGENSLPSTINVEVEQSEGQSGMGEQDYGMRCSLGEETRSTVQSLLSQLNNTEGNDILLAYEDILFDLDAIRDKTIEDFNEEYGQYLDNTSFESEDESYSFEDETSRIAGLK